MEFRIADTFTASLARLTGEEQKAVKTAAFDLQLNPAQPGLQFHKLDKPKDPNFCSIRVNRDVRLIVHRTGLSLLLCYVAHHDEAYHWAERRKLETHPKTGAAQLVEVRETVQEILVPRYVEVERPAPPKPRLFGGLTDEKLLGYGVPVEWLADARNATEDNILDLADHLPAEAAEALLDLAIGVTPKTPEPAPAGADPFAHPDAQRRFRVMANVEELERALDYPWEKWTVFLHPAQRQLVERNYGGPARVSGSAGTGKTIVALHRAVHLARANPDARVLLTTFSETLAFALHAKLRALIGNQPRLGERIDVYAIATIGRRLYELNFGPARLAPTEVIGGLLRDAAEGAKFSPRFLLTEWRQVVDAWQLESWEAYRDVARLGRKTRLPENRRAVLWSIFEKVRAGLRGRGLVTYSDIFSRLAAKFAGDPHPPFDFAVVDEAQDIDVAQLRFLAALGANCPNALFFAGDLGQRIFQQPFSWKALGVDVRGRSSSLRINYRTSHQIRTQADRLLGPEVSDVDGNTEQRNATVSLFNGPPPEVSVFDSPADEIQAVGKWLTARANAGVLPHEIGVFVRSAAQLDRAQAAVSAAGLSFKLLGDTIETAGGHVALGAMHLAKGLEFRAVAVMACDDEIIPLQERIESVTDDADLEEVYNTERHLLYVACTRARDNLLVTGAAHELRDPCSPPIKGIGVEEWPIDRFVFYARNPRKNDAAVDRMCSSIREFGFKIPVLARGDGTVVDGHLRLKAARKLGSWPGGDVTGIPVILCDEWSETQVKAFRLLVNRSVAWADWDEELLALELQELNEADFDLSLTGFKPGEIDGLLAIPDDDGASGDSVASPVPRGARQFATCATISAVAPLRIHSLATSRWICSLN